MLRAPALLLAALLAAMAGAVLAGDPQQRLTMQPISLVGSAAAANGEGPGAVCRLVACRRRLPAGDSLSMIGSTQQAARHAATG